MLIVVMTMMFNGLLCVDSDASDFTKDSGGSSCGGECETYYREKLLATLKILENKEETILIQASSLGVAEDRIAELSKRAGALKAELDRKAQELSKLQQLVDKGDGSITAEMQSDYNCDLKEENRTLKEKNNALQNELDHFRQRNNELDTALRKLQQEQQNERQQKEQELQEAHKKLADVEKLGKEQEHPHETLTRLQQAQVMLNDKSTELTEVQKTQVAQEATIKRLKHDLCQAEEKIKEDSQKLSELSNALARHEQQSQATVAGLEQRLQSALMRCRDLEITYREKQISMSELQASLEEAHANGAWLCEESRRITACVRKWMRRKRQQAREQDEKIRIQELMLHELRQAVEARQHSTEFTSQSESDPCCSNTIIQERCACASETSHARCSRIDKPTCQSETGAQPRCGGSFPRCSLASRPSCTQESGSEMASCSQAPVPPRRLKKQKSCDELSVTFSQVCPQRWPRLPPDSRWALRHSSLRQHSPTDELQCRIQHLNCALEDSQRRWVRHRR